MSEVEKLVVNGQEVELTDQMKEHLMLLQMGEIYHNLMQFDRFKLFMEMNYEVDLVPVEDKDQTDSTIGYVEVKVRQRNDAEVKLIQQKLLQKAQEKIVVTNESALKDMDKLPNGPIVV